jgi:fructose-specific phosphotransferase system IIB component
MKIIAVTRCATGIANTYMAADRLAAAGKAAGHAVKVETQGAMGIENRLGARDLAEADVIILATDAPVDDEQRFLGLPQVRSTTIEAIEDPDRVLAAAVATAVPTNAIAGKRCAPAPLTHLNNGRR